jgi:hypothetical protein
VVHGDPKFRAALVASTTAVTSVKRKSLSRGIHLHHVHKVSEPLCWKVISVSFCDYSLSIQISPNPLRELIMSTIRLVPSCFSSWQGPLPRRSSTRFRLYFLVKAQSEQFLVQAYSQSISRAYLSTNRTFFESSKIKNSHVTQLNGREAFPSLF